jgi:hypothetical protein
MRIREIDITGKAEDEIKQMLRLAGLGENVIEAVLGVKGMVAESEVRFTVNQVIVKWGKEKREHGEKNTQNRVQHEV